jgi:hypothetical protein
MALRDIPRAEWGTFLDRFAREYRARPVTVAKSDLRDGLRIAGRAAPLMAVTHDAAADRISITVGDPPAGEVTHTLVEPESVAIDEPAEAEDDAQVAVHFTGGGQHLVLRIEPGPLHP